MRRVKGMAKIRNVAWMLDRLVMNGIKRLTEAGSYGYWAIMVNQYLERACASFKNHQLADAQIDERCSR
jgi:hypothetical protein